MQRKYAPILPSTSKSPSTDSSGAGKNRQPPSTSPQSRKREQVAVACQACRTSKQKCNAGRPICERCRGKNLTCEYEVEEGEASRYIALKRKFDDLADENDSLRELFDYVRNRPESEAQEIWRRIRLSQNMQEVVQSIRDAQVLLHTSSDSGPNSPTAAALVERLEQQALGDSSVKVPSRPWTTVAGDGIVSELVSSFFDYDDTFFLPFVDKEAFLEDMRNKDPKSAKYCSAFLVNAICALRAHTSPAVKTYNQFTGEDLVKQFTNEAKRRLELDAGKATLPAAQALYILYLLATYSGNDRAGLMYRYAACDMTKRLKLEKRWAKLDGGVELREKRLLARAMWGLFHADSCWSYFYLQPSLLTPPIAIRMFRYEASASTTDHTVGSSLQGEERGRSGVGATESIDLACEVSETLYEILSYNAMDDTIIGSEADLKRRQEFYACIESKREKSPNGPRDGMNVTPQTYLLGSYFEEAAIAIVRPLNPDTSFIIHGDDNKSARHICIEHCDQMIELAEQQLKSTEGKIWTGAASNGAYHATITLVPFLGEEKTHRAFTKACSMLYVASTDFPFLKLVLQGLRALAWTLKQRIPALALQYFEDIDVPNTSLTDVPISFVLPQHEQVREILSDNNADLGDSGMQLGTLISKWAELSVFEDAQGNVISDGIL